MGRNPIFFNFTTLVFSGVWNYDFTLLFVEQLASHFSENVKPVCLPEPGQRFFHRECWIAGFGRTYQQPREYSDFLQETLTGQLLKP